MKLWAVSVLLVSFLALPTESFSQSKIQQGFRPALMDPQEVTYVYHNYGPEVVKAPFENTKRNKLYRNDRAVITRTFEGGELVGTETQFYIEYSKYEWHGGTYLKLRLSNVTETETLSNGLTRVRFGRVELSTRNKDARDYVVEIIERSNPKGGASVVDALEADEDGTSAWIEVTGIEPFDSAVSGTDSDFYLPYGPRSLEYDGPEGRQKPYVFKLEERNRGWVYGVMSLSDIEKYLWEQDTGRGDGGPPFVKISCVRNVQYDFDSMLLSNEEMALARQACEDEVLATIAKLDEEDKEHMDYVKLKHDEELAIFEAFKDVYLEMGRAVAGEKAAEGYFADGVLRFLGGLASFAIVNPIKCVFGVCETAVGIVALPFDGGDILNAGTGLVVKSILSEIPAATGIVGGVIEAVIIAPGNQGRILIFGKD